MISIIFRELWKIFSIIFIISVINSNGVIEEPNLQWDYTLIKGAEAVELPDHGDLIDRDIVWRDMVQTKSFQEAQIAIWKAPVVIPAERSEE